MINWTRQIFKGARRAARPMKQRKPRVEHPYRFVFPDGDDVTIRAYNQREARATVRDALDLTRLPVGTTVQRLDTQPRF